MLTNAGVDLHAATTYSTGAQPAAANYIALTETATPPAAGNTVLTGEISNVGGGLNRAQGVYAHTNGTGLVTVTKNFVATSSDGLPKVVAQAALFNAGAAGTMPHRALLSPTTATVSAPGDELEVAFQITIVDAT